MSQPAEDTSSVSDIDTCSPNVSFIKGGEKDHARLLKVNSIRETLTFDPAFPRYPKGTSIVDMRLPFHDGYDLQQYQQDSYHMPDTAFAIEGRENHMRRIRITCLHQQADAIEHAIAFLNRARAGVDQKLRYETEACFEAEEGSTA